MSNTKIWNLGLTQLSCPCNLTIADGHSIGQHQIVPSEDLCGSGGSDGAGRDLGVPATSARSAEKCGARCLDGLHGDSPPAWP